MPRFSTLLSVLIHATVISVAVLWSIVTPGELPSLRTALAFTDFTRIQLADIPPPPSRRTNVDSNGPRGVLPDHAPTTPPNGITEETLAGASSDNRPGETDGIGIPTGLPDGLPGGRAPEPPPPPAPAPRPPVRIHSGLRAPTKIVHVDPVYPRVAQIAHVEGLVILEAVLDSRGNVESVRVLRSIPLLDQSAIDAVRRWKFTPTLLNGEPVPVVMTVTINFSLKPERS